MPDEKTAPAPAPPPKEPEEPKPNENNRPLNETIPGGAYRIGDQLYNANREPINEKGEVQK
jgi:hypothetical protein